MLRYIVRRLVLSIPILLGVTVITFVFINLIPGDYIDTLIDPEHSTATREDMKALEERRGLDQPPPVQYAHWMKELAQGNLGVSLSSQKPASHEIMRRLVPTLTLTAISLVFSVVVGVGLGIVSAQRPYSILNYVLTMLGFVWIAAVVLGCNLLADVAYAVAGPRNRYD